MNDLIPQSSLESSGLPGPRQASRPEFKPERPYFEPQFETVRAPLWRTLAAPAGALALVLGIGWILAGQIDNATRGPSPEQLAAKAAADSAAAALRAAQTQRQEIAALRGNVETLKSRLEAQAQKTHASEATIATLQKSLAEQKADAAAAASQLQAKLEKVQTQTEKAVEKALDKTPVATIAKPLPTALPKPAAPGPYRAFVLRDIDNGRAVVEGPHGLEEVGPGDALPGGARVERIERRGPNWVVLTDRGFIQPDGRWDD